MNNWCWSWNCSTLATSREELTHWKRLWCWEGLGAGGEGDDRGWDCWMASLTWWTWIWVNSGSWWWTGRPGTLRFMGLQSRTRLSDWTVLKWYTPHFHNDHKSLAASFPFQTKSNVRNNSSWLCASRVRSSGWYIIFICSLFKLICILSWEDKFVTGNFAFLTEFTRFLCWM